MKSTIFNFGLFSILSFGVVAASPAKAVAPIESRASLAQFQLKNLAGKKLSSEDLKGKVAVISFWATWCAPCKDELDALNNLFAKHADKGLWVLGIATDGPETLASVRSITKRKRWAFQLAADPDGSLGASLNPKGSVPYSLFIDRRGRVAHAQAGFTGGDAQKYQAIIEQLLAEPGL